MTGYGISRRFGRLFGVNAGRSDLAMGTVNGETPNEYLDNDIEITSISTGVQNSSNLNIDCEIVLVILTSMMVYAPVAYCDSEITVSGISTGIQNTPNINIDNEIVIAVDTNQYQNAVEAFLDNESTISVIYSGIQDCSISNLDSELFTTTVATGTQNTNDAILDNEVVTTTYNGQYQNAPDANLDSEINSETGSTGIQDSPITNLDSEVTCEIINSGIQDTASTNLDSETTVTFGMAGIQNSSDVNLDSEVVVLILSTGIQDTASANIDSEILSLISNTGYQDAPLINLDNEVICSATTNETSQIIIDHTSVDLYDNIPTAYMTAAKSMWLGVLGESHATAYSGGLVLLYAGDSNYPVSYDTSGPPEGPRSDAMRVNHLRRVNDDYWSTSTGEGEWYTNATGIANIEDHLDYCDVHTLDLSVLMFGWCWDMTWINTPTMTKDTAYGCGWAGSSDGGPDGNLAWGLNAADTTITSNDVCMDTYLAAVENYIDYCDTNEIDTTVIFTTGPVDEVDGNGGYDPETMWQRQVKHDYIRSYVELDSSRILFDFADILAWNNAGTEHTHVWIDGNEVEHTYQRIADDNMLDLDGDPFSTGYHFGERGAVRLAKALWVLAARIAGWSGETNIQNAPSVNLDSETLATFIRTGIQDSPVTNIDNEISSTFSQTGIQNSATYNLDNEIENTISGNSIQNSPNTNLDSEVASAFTSTGIQDTSSANFDSETTSTTTPTGSQNAGASSLDTEATVTITMPSTPDLGLHATSVVFGDEVETDRWEVIITYGLNNGGWESAMLADFTPVINSAAAVVAGVLQITSTANGDGDEIHGLRFNLAMRVDSIHYHSRIPSGVSAITTAWMGTHLATNWDGSSGYQPNPGQSMANAVWGPTWEACWDGAAANAGTTLAVAGTWYYYDGAFTNTNSACSQNSGTISNFAGSHTRDYAHCLGFGCYAAAIADGQVDYGEIVITGIVDIS